MSSGSEASSDRIHTIVTAKYKVEDRLQAKNAKEVPTDAGHPPWIHILCSHTSLEHALELDSQGKWQFH
jgi:hypothetical protein